MRSFFLCLLLAGPAVGLLLSPTAISCIQLVAQRAVGQHHPDSGPALRQCLSNIPIEIKASVDQLFKMIPHFEPKIWMQVAYKTCMGDLGKSLQDGTALPANCVDLFIKALDGIRTDSTQRAPPQQPIVV